MNTINEFLISLKTSSYNEFVKALKENKLTSDIYTYLDNVPQNPKWHPELYLSKHVFLVFKVLSRMGMYNLLESALFHDIGKKDTTSIGKNRIYSFGHAERGLEIIPLFKDRMEFFDLTMEITRNHMRYNSGEEVSNNYSLKCFVNADKEMSRSLYYEYFFETDDENNKKEYKKILEDQEFSDKEVIFAVGISGSGKSTYINKTYDKSIVVSSDKLRKEIYKDINDQTNNRILWEKHIPEKMKEVMNKNGKVILDATNLVRAHRIGLLSKFNGCKKTCLVFNINIEEAIERVKKDIVNDVYRSNVPENVIRKQFRSFNKYKSSVFEEFNEVIEFNNVYKQFENDNKESIVSIVSEENLEEKE